MLYRNICTIHFVRFALVIGVFYCRMCHNLSSCLCPFQISKQFYIVNSGLYIYFIVRRGL
jgi:hypothetical protein